MTTGELIKQARQNSKMTQKELAEKVGVSYQMIQAWENNRRNPKTETIKKIATSLNVPWYTLCPDQQSIPQEAAVVDGTTNDKIMREIASILHDSPKSPSPEQALLNLEKIRKVLKDYQRKPEE